MRNWQAEQRAKYGMDWEDTDAREYNRSRGLPPFLPDTGSAEEMKQAGEIALTGPLISQLS